MPVIKPLNEKLLDRYIRHAVYVERFKAGEAAKISRHLNKEVFPKLIDKLIGTVPKRLKATPWAAERLKRLTLSVDKIISAGMVKAEKATISSLMDLSEWEAKWNKGTIEKLVPLDVDMAMPSTELLRQSVLTTPFEGHKLKTWFKSYKKSVRIKMMGAVKTGISTGESIPAIGSRLRKVASLKRKQAEAIARTAVSSVVNNSKEAVFAQNTDLIKAVQLVATLDTRTTLVCINLDGKTFPVGDGPRPPMHFSCRTTTIPVIASWKEFGIKAPPPATRASMTGKVPAKQTYKGWLRKQNKAIQVKVLGKKRAELYRSGQVTIDKFVDKDYKPLTLKQLAQREEVALPAPPTVRAMSTKGSGVKLTATEKQSIFGWGDQNHQNIVKAQLGKSLNPYRPLNTTSSALKEAANIERSLKKLDGFSGVSYRGLEFKTAAERTAFLGRFKKGGVWRSKAFQSASRNEQTAKMVFSDPSKGVILRINGKSGRLVSKYTENIKEAEVLFMKGVPLKVDKIVGNRVYLSEVTKQAQLKVLPVPPVTPKVVETVYHGTSIKAAKQIREEGFKAGKSIGMTSTPVKEFSFVTPHKAGAEWYGRENIRFKGKYDIVEAKLEGRLYAVKGSVNEFQAMAKFAKDAGIMKAEEHLLDLPAIARELNRRGLVGISYKDSVSNRMAYAVLPDKLKVVKAAPFSVPTTMTKVGTTFTKTTSKGFQGLVDKTVDAYPEKVKLALNDQGVSFKAGNRLTELYPELKGRHPRGWSPGTTWDSCEGMYHLKTKSITVTETYRPVRSKVFAQTSKERVIGTLNHETGHGFNRSPGIHFSNTTGFVDSYRKDIKNISEIARAKNQLGYFMQKGVAGRDETFAEVFANLMGQGAGADISEHFPNCKAYIEGLLK